MIMIREPGYWFVARATSSDLEAHETLNRRSGTVRRRSVPQFLKSLRNRNLVDERICDAFDHAMRSRNEYVLDVFQNKYG